MSAAVYPHLEALPFAGSRGETLWRVTREIRVQVAPEWWVTVPEGYVSNLGTIPRIPLLRWLVSPSDFPGPFVIHDWMCNESHEDEKEIDSGYSRLQADSTIHELLRHYRPVVSAYKRWLIYAVLRMYATWKGLK